MAHIHKTDAEYIATTNNVARFFTEHRQVALVLLLATFVWGWFGYQNMPKRKDPNIPVRVASAQCQWPGATTEQVEQLITRPIEQAVALNSTLKPPSPSDFGIRSLSFPGLSVVYIQLNDNVRDKESIIYAFPLSVAAGPVRTDFENIARIASRNSTLSDLHFFEGPGYVGLDASTKVDDATIRRRGERLIQENLHRS